MKKGLLTFTFLALSLTILRAQLVLFKFETNSTTGNPTGCPTQGNFNSASLSNASVSSFSFAPGVGLSCSAQDNSLGTTGWTSSSTMDASQYLEVTLTANPGYRIDLTSAVVSISRFSAGPQSACIAHNITGAFTSVSPVISVGTSTSTSTNTTWNFTPFSTSATGQVKFRIYAWNATSGNSLMKLWTFTLYGSMAVATPIANTSQLGWVQLGNAAPAASNVSGLNINSSGVLTAAQATNTTMGAVQIGGSSSNGGNGSGLNINSGLLSVAQASSSVLGAIKVGDGLNINNGTLSVNNTSLSNNFLPISGGTVTSTGSSPALTINSGSTGSSGLKFTNLKSSNANPVLLAVDSGGKLIKSFGFSASNNPSNGQYLRYDSVNQVWAAVKPNLSDFINDSGFISGKYKGFDTIYTKRDATNLTGMSVSSWKSALGITTNSCLDTSAVHLSGTETITGSKSFIDTLRGISARFLGSVGVGTTPQAKLHTSGSLRFDNVDSSSADAVGDIYFRSASNGRLGRLAIGGDTSMVLSVKDGLPAWKKLALPVVYDSSKWKLNGNDINNKNSGNIGIGVTTPTSKLHVYDNKRDYLVNKKIMNTNGVSVTTDTVTIAANNYLLLHRACTYKDIGVTYDNHGDVDTINGLSRHYVLGKVTAIRGGVGMQNRMWTIEVNTSSAFNTNRGSLLKYNEDDGTDLVLVSYLDTMYLAIRIPSQQTLFDFSFTGYAYQQNLKIITEQQVDRDNDNDYGNPMVYSFPDPFTSSGSYDPSQIFAAGDNQSDPQNVDNYVDAIATQGNLHVEGTVSIGTASQPRAVLDVNKFVSGGSLGTVLARQSDGNNAGSGTFLGVRVYGTQNNTYGGKSFSLEHSFYGQTNSAINFYRGMGHNGGFITISTNGGLERVRIDSSGSVGIGTHNIKDTAYRLFVETGIRTRKVKVDIDNWPDYVFERPFKLRTLEELGAFVSKNRHLPDVPSAIEVAKDGINLGANQAVLLKKIEELTLYMIEQNERINILERKLKSHK